VSHRGIESVIREDRSNAVTAGDRTSGFDHAGEPDVESLLGHGND
jgi:hypothetical protein